MDIGSVKSLFELFSGEESANFMPFITLAVAETENMLSPAADANDVRLGFLAAAMANYRLRQAEASRDLTTATYAGKMLKAGETSPLSGAAALLRDYLQLCDDIIKRKTFVFSGVSGGEKVC